MLEGYFLEVKLHSTLTRKKIISTHASYHLQKLTCNGPQIYMPSFDLVSMPTETQEKISVIVGQAKMFSMRHKMNEP